MNNTVIIVVVIVAIALILIYTQSSQPKIEFPPKNIESQALVSNPPTTCQHCEITKRQANNPGIINIVQDQDNYSDLIKKQDLYNMNDPLTYPQMRLPREVLEKYNEYYQKNGEYPPFGQATKPLFDNPIINGILVKVVEENEPFTDDIPSAIPLFRVKSVKNTNRFFYYIIDQKYNNGIALKIPLENVKINSRKYNNADYYGLPELYEGDIIENIPIYPYTKYKVNLYKHHHFP